MESVTWEMKANPNAPWALGEAAETALNFPPLDIKMPHNALSMPQLCCGAGN